MVHFISSIKGREVYRDRKHTLMVVRGWSREEGGLTASEEHGVSFGMENKFWNLMEVLVAQYCKSTKYR